MNEYLKIDFPFLDFLIAINTYQLSPFLPGFKSQASPPYFALSSMCPCVNEFIQYAFISLILQVLSTW